jgi:mRNA interferase MazF
MSFLINDQIRTVDKARLIKKLGQVDRDVEKILATLTEMFTE